jgi:hypothetical protein
MFAAFGSRCGPHFGGGKGDGHSIPSRSAFGWEEVADDDGASAAAACSSRATLSM